MLLAKRICRIVEGLSIRLRGDIVKISVSAFVCSVDKGFKPKVDEVIGAVNETATAAQSTQGQVMSCHLGLDEGMGDVRYVSIDRLLAQLASGEVTEVTPLLDDAVDQLIPLITLMSEQQLRQVLGRHAMLEDAIAH